MEEQNTAVEETAASVEESGVIEVSASKDDLKSTIPYDFGKDLDEMVEKFGAEVVHTNARANMKITLQGAMRRYLVAGKDCAELTEIWKPGVQLERTVDPLAVAKKAFGSMSEEERAAFIAQLQAD